MQDYVVVIIALMAGLLAVAILSFLCFFLIRHIRSTRRRKPERTTSRVYPRISSPIYAISTNSIDKKQPAAGDTFKKFSVFDRKRSSAFSTKSAYFDVDASPRVAHKEYLDFNAIEAILPQNVRNNSEGRYYSQGNPVYKDSTSRRHRTDRSEQRSFDSDETGSTHVSKESLQGTQIPVSHTTHISVIEERPFGENVHNFEPVREIFRENHVSYRRDE